MSRGDRSSDNCRQGLGISKDCVRPKNRPVHRLVLLCWPLQLMATLPLLIILTALPARIHRDLVTASGEHRNSIGTGP